jgi:hypothetical protein
MSTINKTVISDAIDEEHCGRLISQYSQYLTPAMFWSNGTRVHDPKIRDAFNYKFHDPGLTGITRSIVSRFSGEDVHIARVEPLEIVCYPPGNGNERHLDGPHRSHSIVFFLNRGYGGGELVFDDGSVFRDMAIGSAVVWENGPEAYHAGNPIVRGLKWIIVSWVRRPDHMDSEPEIHARLKEANEARLAEADTTDRASG